MCVYTTHLKATEVQNGILNEETIKDLQSHTLPAERKY